MAAAPPPSPLECRYHLGWIEETFRSRRVTQELLKPEVENGNLPPGEYDALVSFLPGLHRYYGLLGIFLGPLVPALWTRRMPGTLPSMLCGAGATVLGNLARFREHEQFFKSIDQHDLPGLERALQNVDAKTGRTRNTQSGAMFARRFSEDDVVPSNMINNNIEGDYSQTQSDGQPTSISAPASSTSGRPASRWAEIRAANGSAAGYSSWDRLRQKYERVRNEPGDNGTGTPEVDRESEQARFDAMLEKERNMK